MPLLYLCDNNRLSDDYIQIVKSFSSLKDDDHTIANEEGRNSIHILCRRGNLQLVKHFVSFDKIDLNTYVCALSSEENRLIRYLEDLPFIDAMKPKEDSNTKEDDENDEYNNEYNNESSMSTNMNEEEKEEAKIEEKKGKDKHMNDNKTQFEYGKKLFKKALKYLNMSKRKGSSASSVYITKYIKELDIEQDQTHKKNENDFICFLFVAF